MNNADISPFRTSTHKHLTHPMRPAHVPANAISQLKQQEIGGLQLLADSDCNLIQAAMYEDRAKSEKSWCTCYPMLPTIKRSSTSASSLWTTASHNVRCFGSKAHRQHHAASPQEGLLSLLHPCLQNLLFPEANLAKSQRSFPEIPNQHLDVIITKSCSDHQKPVEVLRKHTLNPCGQPPPASTYCTCGCCSQLSCKALRGDA